MSTLEDRRKARRHADIVSVRSLADYLQNVSSDPAKYMDDATLRSALKSQGALAKYAIPEASVCAMSLNHQRLISDLAIGGGYETLDQLRRSALEAVVAVKLRASRGNTRSKDGLLTRVRELEFEAALLKHDLALLQRAYDLRCLQARSYASAAGPGIQELCAKEQKELDASFSLRRKAAEPSNVVSLDSVRTK